MRIPHDADLMIHTRLEMKDNATAMASSAAGRGRGKRRVLYVEGNEDGTVGGSHKILFDLVTRLSPRYEPVVLFFQDNAWADRIGNRGVEVITWDSVRARERAAMSQSGKIAKVGAWLNCIAERRAVMRERGVDLLHLNNSPINGYDDWLLAARLERVPCVVYGMGGVPRVRNPLRRALMRSFDAYFPLSGLVAAGLQCNGVDPDKVVLTYPGVDIAEHERRRFTPTSEVRETLELREGQLLAVMVGNLRRWKGQHVALEALAALTREERDRMKVLLVGEARQEEDADYVAELEETVRRHDLGDVVAFTGRRDDVPDLLEAADIAVHASVVPEPFGLVVQEAMLHGCATVASNAGGPTEMLGEGGGILFDVRNPRALARHLRDLISDERLRARLSSAARRQAHTFDVRRHVAFIEARYERLIA